jgi:hypothetical protein
MIDTDDLPNLDYMRELVSLLKDAGVRSFNAGDLSLEFQKEKAPEPSFKTDQGTWTLPEGASPKAVPIDPGWDEVSAKVTSDMKDMYTRPELWMGSPTVPHFPERGTFAPPPSKADPDDI